MLFDGVWIGRGAKVRRAILECGTKVAPGARIGYDPAVDRERFTVSEGGITIVADTTVA